MRTFHKLLSLYCLLTIGSYHVFAQRTAPTEEYLCNDSHFHLTNYIQEGITARKFVEDIMGSKVSRSTLFGIPLQQQWSYGNSGLYAPTYYLQSDAPLYYYSFTDAYIATQYLRLPKSHQDRLDPMITGFNPTDMYAAKHIERVLRTYPGVFTGIGEFTIHKEFVSSKVAGEVASLINPALDSVLEFAGRVGLLVILHSDIDMPMAKDKATPVYLDRMKDLLRRHPRTTIIWAHTGLGRVVHPTRPGSDPHEERPPNHLEILEDIASDPDFSHVYFDISWDEVAKYVIASADVTARTARLFNKYPDRFLFGTDVVAPPDQKFYMAVYEMYKPLWEALTPETSRKIRKGNYVRLFDRARKRVRAWERDNI